MTAIPHVPSPKAFIDLTEIKDYWIATIFDTDTSMVILACFKGNSREHARANAQLYLAAHTMVQNLGTAKDPKAVAEEVITLLQNIFKEPETGR